MENLEINVGEEKVYLPDQEFYLGSRTNYVLNMYNSGKSLANVSLNFDLIDERMNHSDKE
jgi:hypothetical protein